MKKKVFLKGFLSLLGVVALVLGIFQLSVPSADASFQCPERLFGNEFSHVSSSGGICCCIYVTPGGEEVQGPSWNC